MQTVVDPPQDSALLLGSNDGATAFAAFLGSAPGLAECCGLLLPLEGVLAFGYNDWSL